MNRNDEYFLCNVFNFGAITDTQESVSYTHLDVYKRQVKELFNFPAGVDVVHIGIQNDLEHHFGVVKMCIRDRDKAIAIAVKGLVQEPGIEGVSQQLPSLFSINLKFKQRLLQM